MKIKEYENHQAVPNTYKWDLKELLGGKTPEVSIDKIFSKLEYFVLVKDSKYDSPESYLDFLQKYDELIPQYLRIDNFLTLSSTLNVVDSYIENLLETLSFKMHEHSIEIGSESSRFLEHIEKIIAWKDLPGFSPYRHYLMTEIENSKYYFPKNIDSYLIKKSYGDVNVSDVFNIITNSEIDLGVVNVDGVEVKITDSNLYSLLKNPSREVRESAGRQYSNNCLAFKNTLTNLLYQHLKQTSVSLKLQGFDSSVQGLLFDDRVSEEFLINLYQNVRNIIPFFGVYDEHRKKFFELKTGEKFGRFDGSVDLIKLDDEITIEKCINDVLDSLKPFGEEYYQVASKALLEERWVDFMPIKNKQSGAFSSSACYGFSKKHILMNFDGTFSSVETLAHEMGHSMHTYFSDNNNNFINSNYSIFVAEIASTFNELLLYDHYLSGNPSLETQFHIYESIIKAFSGTVIRQVVYSNFEYDCYQAIDKGEPIGNWEVIRDIFKKNIEKYRTPNPLFPIEEQDLINIVTVPHLYADFYVYKYSIGLLVALIFFDKYKKEGTDSLKRFVQIFLSGGSSKKPLDLLKDAGVDLLNSDFSKEGFHFVKEAIDKYVEIGNKLFSPEEGMQSND